MAAHHIPFPSIESFKQVMKGLEQHEERSLAFAGTVKLHGTNAAVCLDVAAQELWCQSRNSIITVEKDNAGFAGHIHKAQQVFLTQLFPRIMAVAETPTNTPDIEHIAIFGEWCGKGIQRQVAICELPRMFVVFAVQLTLAGGDTVWQDAARVRNISSSEHRIFNIYDFPVFHIAINLDDIRAAQAELVRLTKAVEDCCPVASRLGVQGVGEGIVWQCLDARGQVLRFKTKGELHSATVVKEVVAVDLEQMDNAQQFVEATVTAPRFDQAIEHIYKMDPSNALYGKAPAMKDVPRVVAWVWADILKEDTDLLAGNGLAQADIMPLLRPRVAAMMKALVLL